jgi:hypothetical protein
MNKINIEQIPRVSVKEISVLPIDELLEFAVEAEENLQAAKRFKDRIHGAIALKCSTNKNIMEA